MFLSFLSRYRDAGLLVLRIGIGVMFILHGESKIFGGVERWTKLGKAMTSFGITFMPAFWGFMAAVSEFVGGICVMLGLFFRPAATLMIITMVVAAAWHLHKGDTIMQASHAIESAFLFLGLLFIGSGKYSLDEKLKDVFHAHIRR